MHGATQADRCPDAEAFYNALAGSYDELTDRAGRTRAAERFVGALVDRLSPWSALDVACGAGLFTLPLAAVGVRTTGADISEEMLVQGRERARASGLSVDWVRAPMQSLAASLSGRFELILCMGNSLPHLLSAADLEAAFAGFARLLSPGGHLVLHLLNYRKVLDQRERIVDITRRGDREYIRFYDFAPEHVVFNVLTVDWRGARPQHALTATPLYPYRLNELREALAAHGFAETGTYGDLEGTRFHPEQSDVLLLEAEHVSPDAAIATPED